MRCSLDTRFDQICRKLYSKHQFYANALLSRYVARTIIEQMKIQNILFIGIIDIIVTGNIDFGMSAPKVNGNQTNQ